MARNKIISYYRKRFPEELEFNEKFIGHSTKSVISSPPLETPESALFLSDIDTLLHNPVKQAQERLKNARSNREKERARISLSKQEQRYLLHSAIFALHGTGESVEEIVDQLGMTSGEDEKKVRYLKRQTAQLLSSLNPSLNPTDNDN